MYDVRLSYHNKRLLTYLLTYEAFLGWLQPPHATVATPVEPPLRSGEGASNEGGVIENVLSHHVLVSERAYCDDNLTVVQIL